MALLEGRAGAEGAVGVGGTSSNNAEKQPNLKTDMSGGSQN